MIIGWLLTLAFGLLILGLIGHVMSRPKNLPPGPSLLPLFNDIWKLFRGRTEPLDMLSSWAEKYGEIVCFYVSMKPFVVLNSYQAITEAFHHPDLQDRPRSKIIEDLIGSKNSGVLLARGNIWKEQRQFVHSVFRSLGVGKSTYESTVAGEMARLGAAIKEKKGTSFDPSEMLGQAVSNIISSIIFGTQYTYDDAEFLKLLHIIDTNFRLSGGGGALFFVPLPGVTKFLFGSIKRLVDSLRDLYAFISTQIEAHEKNRDPDNPRDFIDQYLNKMAENKDSTLSFNKQNLVSSISDVFSAGTETTATALKWCILYMMAYPEIQSRVQDELDHVVGRDRQPKLNDRKDLPYTNAVLMEVQRKGAVVPLVPRVAATDVMIQGYTIPKGAIIVANIFEVLNSGKLWKDSDSFKPERFLQEDGHLITRDELIFFSTGRRVCLGEQLARMETFLGFTSLLHQFTFKKPDESEPLSFKGVLGMTRNSTPYMTCAIPRE